MIEVTNLKKSYDNRLEVIKRMSFVIDDNVIFGIIGESGSGKTTLLNCLVGLEKDISGSIMVDGIDISNLKGKSLREFRKNIGMIFQDFCLLSRKNVYQNIALPLEFWGYPKEYVDKRVKELVKMVGLDDKISYRPNQLSGGQKQRVAIARALALQPKYLFCDEATSSLDPKTTNSILQLLKRIKMELGITIVIVTHEMDVVEKYCDKVGILKDGVIESIAYVKEMFLENDGKMIKKYTEQKTDYKVLDTELIFHINFAIESETNRIICEMAKHTINNFELVDAKSYNFNDGKYISLMIKIKKENRNEYENFLKENNVSYGVGSVYEFHK